VHGRGGRRDARDAPRSDVRQGLRAAGLRESRDGRPHGEPDELARRPRRAPEIRPHALGDDTEAAVRGGAEGRHQSGCFISDVRCASSPRRAERRRQLPVDRRKPDDPPAQGAGADEPGCAGEQCVSAPSARCDLTIDDYLEAWVIHYAYEEFAEGVGKMNFMRPYEASDNAGVAGMLGALAAMSNGIMRDERVMHISDPQFLVKFNKQVIFEANAVRAWTHEGPELVIQKALERQERDGWRSVRHALAVTVRAWMMRALMEGGLRAQHTVSVDFYKNCLLVIRTLRDKWSSSSKDDRGVIFEKTFEFGIAKMYLEAIMQAYNPNTAPEMLDLLQTEADRLIREIEEFMALPKPQEPLDPGFMSSFCLYPKGQAYSMRGFLQVQLIRLHPEDAREYQAKAAPEYLKAAACFPPDDEKHAWFLKVALSNQESSGKFTVREILDTMQRIAESAPKAKAIWERSALGMGGAWEALAGVAKQEAHLRQLVAQGKFSMDSCVSVE
ncbi:unnamed protein product, partial [Mycena citricolor]